jgi:hypothetical protein
MSFKALRFAQGRLREVKNLYGLLRFFVASGSSE